MIAPGAFRARTAIPGTTGPASGHDRLDAAEIGVQDGLVWLSEGKYNYALHTMDLMRDNKIDPLPGD